MKICDIHSNHQTWLYYNCNWFKLWLNHDWKSQLVPVSKEKSDMMDTFPLESENNTNIKSPAWSLTSESGNSRFHNLPPPLLCSFCGLFTSPSHKICHLSSPCTCVTCRLCYNTGVVEIPTTTKLRIIVRAGPRVYQNMQICQQLILSLHEAMEKWWGFRLLIVGCR